LNILFLSQIEPPERWLPGLRAALPADRFFTLDAYDPAQIDIALVACPKPGILGALPRLQLVQSMFMGVDPLLADARFPRTVMLARLIDTGMVNAMGETAIAHILDWHRHHYAYRQDKLARRWNRLGQHLPSDRMIGILGMGELGTSVSQRLLALGFGVCGWSRRPRQVPGVQGFHGDAGLQALLAQSDALVCLLPLTAQTRGVMNAANLARMKPGGCIINLARGAHAVVPDVLAALDSGRLAHAYLDVFEVEPLPQDSPLWAHPGVTITPHAAAITEPRTAIQRIAANIELFRAGKPLPNLVDFGAGY
jgi:glyoxylate/hydroxypyruvate reductase A